MFKICSLSLLIVCVSSNDPSKEPSESSPGFQLCSKHEHLEVDSQACRLTCSNRTEIGLETVCATFTGCVCNPGYFRLYDNGTGPCVSEKECPPDSKHCGPNEELSNCEITCPPQTCEGILISFKCGKKTKCRTGCNCVKGYVRNSIGICIPKRLCHTSLIIYPPRYHSVHQYQEPGLLNRDGASSLESGVSSPVTQSSAILAQSSSTSNASASYESQVTCIGPNQVYDECPPVCLLENCDDVDCPPVPCTKEQKCVPQCICKENFFRNGSNTCIHVDDCPYYDII